MNQQLEEKLHESFVNMEMLTKEKRMEYTFY